MSETIEYAWIFTSEEPQPMFAGQVLDPVHRAKVLHAVPRPVNTVRSVAACGHTPEWNSIVGWQSGKLGMEFCPRCVELVGDPTKDEST